MSTNATETLTSDADVHNLPPGTFAFSKSEVFFHYINLSVCSTALIIFLISTWQCTFYLYRNRENIYRVGLVMSFVGFLLSMFQVIWAFLFHVDCSAYVYMHYVLNTILVCLIKAFLFMRVAEWMGNRRLLLVGAAFIIVTVVAAVPLGMMAKAETTVIGICLATNVASWFRRYSVVLIVQVTMLLGFCAIAGIREKNTKSLQQLYATLFKRGFIMLIIALLMGLIFVPILSFGVTGRYKLVFFGALRATVCRFLIEQLRFEDTLRHGPRIAGISSFSFKLAGDGKRTDISSSGVVSTNSSTNRSTGSNFAPFTSIHNPGTVGINFMSKRSGPNTAYPTSADKGETEPPEVSEYIMDNLPNSAPTPSNSTPTKRNAESMITITEEDMSDSTVPPSDPDNKIKWPDHFP